MPWPHWSCKVQTQKRKSDANKLIRSTSGCKEITSDSLTRYVRSNACQPQNTNHNTLLPLQTTTQESAQYCYWHLNFFLASNAWKLRLREKNTTLMQRVAKSPTSHNSAIDPILKIGYVFKPLHSFDAWWRHRFDDDVIMAFKYKSCQWKKGSFLDIWLDEVYISCRTLQRIFNFQALLLFDENFKTSSAAVFDRQ